MRIQLLKVSENLKGKGKALSHMTDDLALPSAKIPTPLCRRVHSVWAGGGACTCRIELGGALNKT